MTTLMIVAGALLFIVLLAAIGFAFYLVIVKSTSGLGGWSRLAARFRAEMSPPEPTATRQTIRVGMARYRRCTTVAILPAGLYL
ncbi:MAG: hypothetical protein ABIF77_18625, partial [bacterium]